MTLALCPSPVEPARDPRRPARAARQHDLATRVRALTRLLAVVTAGLAAWIVILAAGLPAAGATGRGRLLWVGFDLAELAGLAVTLWAVARSRQLAIPAALITGTLFVCDAWFDVVLSLGTDWWWLSVAGAVLLELPLAVLLWGSARWLVHAVIAEQVPDAVDAHLRRLSLVPSAPAAAGRGDAPDDRRAAG